MDTTQAGVGRLDAQWVYMVPYLHSQLYFFRRVPMAASAFLVKLDDQAPRSALINGANAMVVWAEDATAARQVAASYYDGDANALWTDSTTTATAIVADADSWENFAVNILVAHPTTRAIVADVTYSGTAANDTIDEIAAQLVILLNATVIDNASYDNATNILTVAAIADGIGDHVVTAKVYRKVDARKQAIPHLIGAITDEGVAAAALTIQLATDALNVPKVYAALRS